MRLLLIAFVLSVAIPLAAFAQTDSYPLDDGLTPEQHLSELELQSRQQPKLALGRLERLLERFNYLQPAQLCKALQLASLSHLGLGQNHNAKQRAKRAVECAREQGLYDELVYDLKLQAIAAHKLLEEVEAFGYYLEALKYLDRVTSPQRRGDILASVANVYISIGDYDQALYFAERSSVGNEASPDGRCVNSMLLLRIYQKQGRRQQIEESYLAAGQSCQDSSNTYLVISALLEQAIADVTLGRYREALAHLDNAWTRLQQGQIQLNIAPLFYYRALALKELGRFDEAQSTIDEFRGRFHGQWTSVLTDEFEYLQAEVDTALARYPQAVEHYRKALKAREDAAVKMSSLTLAVQRIEMDALQQQAQVKEAQALQKAHEAELERERARSKGYIAVSAAITFGIVGMALVNRRMGRSRNLYKDLAHYDSMTGLYSRWFWLQSSQSRCAALDPATPVSVIMLRIDKLRDLNLEYGYGVGDGVLQRVAAELKACLPESAQVGRTAGNQMALLLPEMSRPSAEALSERIRQRIEHLPPEEMDLKRGITVTLGVCGYSRQRELSELVLKADKALEEGRRGDGNQVYVFEGS